MDPLPCRPRCARRVRAALAAAAVRAIVACQLNPSDPDDAASRDREPAADTAADAPAPRGADDAAALLDRASMGGACNALPDPPLAAVMRAVPEPPPVALGGAIVDGTYDLTEIRSYADGDAGPRESPAPLRVTWVIAGAVAQSAVSVAGHTTRMTVALSASGTRLTQQLACGAPDTSGTESTQPFTATAAALELFAGEASVMVLLRRP